MAKRLTDLNGDAIVRACPVVKNVKPLGTLVLLEVLSAQEALGTKLHVSDGALSGAPQGYIRDLGPMVKPEFGLKVGDRVVLSGNFTPLPEMKELTNRPLILVEPHQIKAVLIESDIVNT